jgi:large conductance mechanosensitive channel
MFKEFRAFIMKGNVIDFAIAVIFGGAFAAIINSLVADIITPLILAPALKAAGVDDIAALSWNGVHYGKFISVVLSFLVIAFVLFLIVKVYNRMKKAEAPAAPAGPTEVQLLTEIRDALKK